jgi:hypothetical protein
MDITKMLAELRTQREQVEEVADVWRASSVAIGTIHGAK